MRNWQKTEKKVASTLKGKKTPGSGNKRIKGDVLTKEYLIEVKETSLPKFRVNLLWFAKIKKEAQTFNKFPALVLEFYDKKMLCFVLSDKEYFDINWTSLSYVTFSYDDLSKGNVIATPYGIWEVVHIEDLRE